MHIQAIRTLIDEGYAIERKSGVLRQAIVNLASAQGWQQSASDIQDIVAFVGEYVEHAPALMAMIEVEANKLDVLDDVQPILDATEDYFLAADDIIPDHLGLVGLLDDAYLTHSLMQAISDEYFSECGKSLLPLEIREINRFMRRLIGEPFVSLLDEHVNSTLHAAAMERNRNQIATALGRLNLAALPDPTWGDALTAEIVDTRLKSMALIATTTVA